MNPIFVYRSVLALTGSIVAVLFISWLSGAIYGAVDTSPPIQSPAVEFETTIPSPQPESSLEPAQALEPMSPPAVGSDLTSEMAALLANADPTVSSSVRIRCATCHTLGEGESHRVGPNLWGVLGRPVAGIEGFAYSDALREVGGTWTWRTLDAFLTNPREFSPGTRMNYRGVADPVMRASLLVFLRAQSSNPLPLP